jgi:glycerophosphoryl diester phosphodiesterase
MIGLGCTTLHLDHSEITEPGLETLVAQGVPVLLYTVNQLARAKRLLADGAAAVFTDVPDTLLAGLAPQ